MLWHVSRQQLSYIERQVLIHYWVSSGFVSNAYSICHVQVLPCKHGFKGESFLWADDLASYDSIIDLPFTIPMYGAHISGFTVLMAASIFVYMKMSSAGQPPQPQQPGMPNMKVIQNIIPFTMLFFFNGFSSGLSLYYFCSKHCFYCTNASHQTLLY